MRKDILANGEIYHIFSRSIAEFKIFNNNSEFERMQRSIKYYQIENEMRFSDFIDSKIVNQEGFHNTFDLIKQNKKSLVQIIAYCLMPTHIHLVLKQLTQDGISHFMKDVLNSYTRYFNTLHKRKGPLWDSRFNNVLIDNDEQLQHLIRYLHLNAATAHLVDKPEDWKFSSYKEYLSEITDNSIICSFSDLFDIKPSTYRKFVNDQISYQRELASIKKLILE